MIKAHLKALQKARRIPMQDSEGKSNSSSNLLNQDSEKRKVQLEDVGEISEENDEKENLDDEIREFLKKGQKDINSRIKMMGSTVPGFI
jgi:hypothetical protein